MENEKEVGVVVSVKEMYDLILEMRTTSQQILARLELFEEKLRVTNDTDERSREALSTAKEALELAQKLESQLQWLSRTVASGFILGAISALFFMLQK
jgi:hypothetical protein